MNDGVIIRDGLEKLKAFVEDEKFRGYDPYDGLQSPFFNLPFLRNNKLIRFGTQQLVKRSPVNLRGILLVSKGYNPVTLGLAIQGYTYLWKVELNNRNQYELQINHLIEELKMMIPKGFSGACWGYDFDWEARHAKIPAYQPTVVATGIIINSLFIAFKIIGNQTCRELILSASKFVMNDLQRTYMNEGSFCFSYSPFDKQQVFNASMKGARILAQSYSISGDMELKATAKKAINFVINQQREDGSWAYSLSRIGGWTDNYHTGYILDCLLDFQELTFDKEYSKNIKDGYKFYIENFISREGAPKFYYDKIHPMDCTAAAQTILTTLKFDQIELAEKVGLWTIINMQKQNGSFKFRKYKHYTVNTSFMRWSDAWMFAALSYLNYKKEI